MRTIVVDQYDGGAGACQGGWGQGFGVRNAPASPVDVVSSGDHVDRLLAVSRRDPLGIVAAVPHLALKIGTVHCPPSNGKHMPRRIDRREREAAGSPRRRGVEMIAVRRLIVYPNHIAGRFLAEGVLVLALGEAVMVGADIEPGEVSIAEHAVQRTRVACEEGAHHRMGGDAGGAGMLEHVAGPRGTPRLCWVGSLQGCLCRLDSLQRNCDRVGGEDKEEDTRGSNCRKRKPWLDAHPSAS